MTPLTKFQLVVKAAAEDCEIPKVIVYAEEGLGDELSTAIWSTEAVERDDYFWMRSWLDEQLGAADPDPFYERYGGIFEIVLMLCGIGALIDWILIPAWRYFSG